ncbi:MULTISPECIES: THUMP-like domain-containing protein [unclassified Microbacterium]|uniref:class I SAM-dependent methyltransferase n=1 Tax=unclassified Microbacterium TaxID=2609290 RepID=UPI000EA896A2|nr:MULTISPECIES: SAM-dependent methyltransferase [unclassified Microbacterium]MBT2485066.1 SAM-dependent methyltransferase [Microbacterium sp. ISL-108]RKN67913.1 SAM-dependent methyltransferase [Microbacterium sp. CGR2]
MSELRALLTPAGLELLDGLGPIETTAEVARAVSRLRTAGHSPELVSAVVGQARLREKARAKFGPFAERMLFTRAGLEQATRLGVAARHAQRMRSAGIAHVTDLGCGIGGDSLAFTGAGLDVLAVDADEVTAVIAAYNLAPFGDSAVVRHATAEDSITSAPAASAAVWMDPARRTAGHGETRRVSADDYSPSLDWAFDVASRMPAGIKLGPAHDRDSLPAEAEAQWVSADGSVVELVVWTGSLAREGVRRAALVIRGDRSHELTAGADADDAAVRPLGAFVHEPDGAVIRARLIGDVARSLDAGMLDRHIAYLTSDSALTSPFVQSFRVRETMPANPKAISAALKANGVGRLEIKKRGMDIDPAAFRKKLTLRGDAEATLILARVGNQRQAILADRVPAAD